MPNETKDGKNPNTVDKKTISDLVEEAHLNAVAHGWWDGGERNFGELLMLIVSEVSEAHEEYRNNHPIDETYYSVDKQGNQKMEERKGSSMGGEK